MLYGLVQGKLLHNYSVTIFFRINVASVGNAVVKENMDNFWMVKYFLFSGQ